MLKGSNKRCGDDSFEFHAPFCWIVGIAGYQTWWDNCTSSQPSAMWGKLQGSEQKNNNAGQHYDVTRTLRTRSQHFQNLRSWWVENPDIWCLISLLQNVKGQVLDQTTDTFTPLMPPKNCSAASSKHFPNRCRISCKSNTPQGTKQREMDGPRAGDFMTTAIGGGGMSDKKSDHEHHYVPLRWLWWRFYTGITESSRHGHWSLFNSNW